MNAVFALLLGCRSDPPVETWHGGVRIEAMTRADGGCDAEAAESEPEAPYLFLAVSRGAPDNASLYWCEEEESCGAPFSSLWLTRLEERALEGELGRAQADDDLCLIRWDDLTASQEGDRVELVFRTGLVTELGLEARECVDRVQGRIGEQCDAVLTLSGTRLE